MLKGLLTAVAVGLVSLAYAFSAPAEAQNSSQGPSDGLAAWEKAYEVFSHPRCVNCHVPDDNRPRWSGPNYGDKPQYHGMNIIADATRMRAAGLPCTTCHRNENAKFPHGAPGAPNWKLAPVEMVWWEKSSAEVCEQIKDPERNGNRTVEEVADHIGHDELVNWGWAPGPGREPAPHSAEDVVAYLLKWQAAGTPCPAHSAN